MHEVVIGSEVVCGGMSPFTLECRTNVLFCLLILTDSKNFCCSSLRICFINLKQFSLSLSLFFFLWGGGGERGGGGGGGC